MSNTVNLPILKELIPDGVEYGANLLVEFEPHSIWYETSFTIAAHALRLGVRTDYHTWMRSPSKVREVFAKLGFDVKKLEQEDYLRILDSYTAQTGLGVPEIRKQSGPYAALFRSVKVSDLSLATAQEIKAGFQELDKRRLHLDDNNSVLAQYNEEKAVIEYYRTRVIPYCKAVELAAIHSLAVGVHSDTMYKQLESFCDGIIDFKSQEKGEKIEHLVRVRLMRNMNYDSRWRHLKLTDNGEVTLVD